MKIKDGGCAFPYSNLQARQAGEPIFGMSLRDYFAAKALQGILMHEFNPDYEDETYINLWYSEKAYDIADAMIKARNK
jgi:hypothetical protein